MEIPPLYVSVCHFGNYSGNIHGDNRIRRIIKKIGIAILSLDSSERIDFWKAKMHRRERYKNYVKKYVEKLMEDQK